MRFARGLAFLTLGVHLVGGAYALTMVPRGFPIGALHFWSNTAIPVVSCLAALAALLATTKTWRGVDLAMTALAAGWLAATVTSALLFPDSMPLSRAALPGAVAIAWCLIAWKLRSRGSLVAAPLGAVAGVLMMLAQRAPLPSTTPSGGTLATEGAESLIVRCGAHVVQLSPMLTFESRSPDRTWTVISPIKPGAELETQHSSLVVHRTDGGEGDIESAELEAVSRLDEPVYAHLDSFARIDFDFRATVAFSTTGATQFPIEESDYPTGRPTKMAYIGADNVLRVVKADDGEKGPYHELAHGALHRGEPIMIEVRPVGEAGGCRFTFADWSAQVSTERSPTAGWGVPQNAIEFFAQKRFSLIALSLASTGPGRGFDSVGHAAGTYRNRVRIEQLETSPP
ncbi:MAG TPA: hypothetical protein VGM90_05230 [Kofleriaceae bacterium]